MDARLISLLRQKWVVPTAVGVASFASGLTLGFVTANYIQRKKNAKQEVPTSTQLELDFGDPITVVEVLIVEKDTSEEEALIVEEMNVRLEEDFARFVESEEKEAPSELQHFVEDTDWSYEEELAHRSRSGKSPYILHQDEFFADEKGYTQTTLTYYSADNILTDENDVPIYNFQSVVGNLRFGHGSTDENVVYIRNPKLQTEYEVVLSDGSYEIEILGHQVEAKLDADTIRHATAPRKFLKE